MGLPRARRRWIPYPALALIALGLALAAMAGCTRSTGPAPVVERAGIGAGPAEREVRAGDTLYSIAWEAGLDFRQVARWNGIDAPHLIRPGQRIRLRPPDGQVATPAPAAVASPLPEPRAPSQPGTPTPAPAPATTAAVAAPDGWVWPAEGPLVQGFQSGANPGIAIGGQAGAPVRAARGGRVVYAGSGLRGYGPLIIIKHDEVFLSAYAHNRKLLVAEGDDVRAGQQIAEMGDSGSTRVALHFEVRRQGNPVDPIALLPRR